MANFKYKALSPDGAAISGVVEAYDKIEAVERIKEKCPVVLEVNKVSASVSEKDFFLKYKTDALGLMCNQFSIILGAGLPLIRTIELVATQTSDKQINKLLTSVSEDVASGRSLALSFERWGEGRLPQIFIETLRAGEESGDLERSFERLSHYFNKSSKTAAKVKAAMIYPVFTIAVAVVVVIIIMVYAVPQFTDSFVSIGMELPIFTRILIAVSNFLSKYIFLILGIFAAAFIGLKVWSKTDKGAQFFGDLALKIPKIGRINQMSAANQFAATMSTMLGSGLNMVQAVAVTAKTLTNYSIAEQIKNCVKGVESGQRLGECMRQCKNLPNLLVEMTAMGEETGSIETTLNVIAEYYAEETDNATQNAIKLLEPVIICFLAGIVVVILLAVYMPMFSIYGSI